MMTDCIFCKIASGEMPAKIVHKDALVTAFRDIRPVTPIHILIIPNRHITSVNDVIPEDAVLLGHLFVTACQIAQAEGISEDGYRLVVNTGPQAGQSVFHIHLHLLAGRHMSWPPG